MARLRTSKTERGKKIKAMVEMGATYKEVEKRVKCTSLTIRRVMEDFEKNKELIEWYDKNKLKVLKKGQMDAYSFQQAILKSFKEDELDDMSPMARAKLFSAMGVDFGIKYDKERLEKNMSTENVGVVIGAINEWKRVRESDG